jgi:hypothetical protein
MREKGLDDYEEEGGDWSIMNYFDTNPKVRKYLVDLWKSENKSVYLGQKQVKDSKTGEIKTVDDIFKMVKEYEFKKERERNGVQLFLDDIENFYCEGVGVERSGESPSQGSAQCMRSGPVKGLLSHS